MRATKLHYASEKKAVDSGKCLILTSCTENVIETRNKRPETVRPSRGGEGRQKRPQEEKSVDSGTYSASMGAKPAPGPVSRRKTAAHSP